MLVPGTNIYINDFKLKIFRLSNLSKVERSLRWNLTH